MSTPAAAPGAKPAQHNAVTPRSAPSPALHRALPAAGRTPVAIKGGTPMVPSLSAASHGSAGSWKQPPGIKLEGASPFVVPFGTPMEGLTPSLGLLEVGKRDEDAERRNKVLTVLGKIATMGRVSDEGVRRVGRWAGFDVEIENKYAAPEHEGERPVVIAGRNVVLIDLAFKEKRVDKVEVTFTSEDEEVAALQKGAAEVLKRNLTVEKGGELKSNLGPFAANLQALARLDRLSSQSVNCVEAVAGLHTSLKRLYEHEVKEMGEEEERAAKRVMREKSGWPGMHKHNRVGLSLDYWSHPRTGVKTLTRVDTEDEVFSLQLTVESNSGVIIPPIRISKDWLGKDVVRPVDSTDVPADLVQLYTGLDWREPPGLEAPSKDPDAMADDFAAAPSTGIDVRFVAHLHPPVVVPYTVATQILQLTGLPSTPPVTQSSYMALLLGPHAQTTVQRKIWTPSGDSAKEATQHISVFNTKPELGISLSAIPFSHPMHLTLALPLLRQWAQVGHILRTTLRPDSKDSTPANRAKLRLDAMLAPQDEPVRMLDINLATAGEPVLTLFAPGEESRPLSIRIGQNGKVSVQSRGEEDEVLARGLEISNDLGLWSEWVSKRGWKGKPIVVDTGLANGGEVNMDMTTDA